MNTFLILALFGYIIYILIIRPIVINARYKELKVELPPNENHDHVTLLERLRDKNFTYPEMKNMRHNESGQVVIEGKFTSHPLEIDGQTIYVGKGMKGGEQKKAKCILEAVVITHYLSKFFNPNAPVDAYKEYQKFRKRRKQPMFVGLGLLVLVLIAFAYQAKDTLVPQLQSNNISSSYLSQYSSTRTIGDTFKAFFGDPKWKSYEQGIQKYVDFQGSLTVNNEPAVAVFTFSISGENFIVDSVKVDNRELNSLEVEAFFQTVYSENNESQIGATSYELEELQPMSRQDNNERLGTPDEVTTEMQPQVTEDINEQSVAGSESSQGIGFPESLLDGRIEGIPIALGDSASTIVETLGAPEAEGIYGTYYFSYPDYVIFLNTYSPETPDGIVSAIAVSSNVPYFDDLLGKTFQEIQLIIGENGVVWEDEIEDGDYNLSYYVGDQLLIFNAPSQTEPATYDELLGWKNN